MHRIKKSYTIVTEIVMWIDMTLERLLHNGELMSHSNGFLTTECWCHTRMASSPRRIGVTLEWCPHHVDCCDKRMVSPPRRDDGDTRTVSPQRRDDVTLEWFPHNGEMMRHSNGSHPRRVRFTFKWFPSTGKSMSRSIVVLTTRDLR